MRSTSGAVSPTKRNVGRKIPTVATSAPADPPRRYPMTGTAPVADRIATLEAVSARRTAEARGEKPKYVEYVPELIDATTHRHMKEAYEYYRKPGYMHPNSPNKMLFTSLGKMLAFTGLRSGRHALHAALVGDCRQ